MNLRTSRALPAAPTLREGFACDQTRGRDPAVCGGPHVCCPASLVRLLPLFLAVAVAVGCGAPAKQSAPPEALAEKTAPVAAPAEAATSSTSGAPAARAADPTKAHLVIIGLSDFHGWLLPEENSKHEYWGGIGNIAGQLVGRENARADNAIIVDNGDMFTGPTESTFLRGEPVIQAYNALGVSAANIANHEFDFGIEILKARESEAKFPFLGANIVKAGTKDQADFAKPFTIVEKDGVKIGIIGLSYIDTPHTTLAKHVAGLEFQAYAPTLQRVVPEVKAKGADVVVVLFHDTIDEIEKVLKQVPDLPINVIVAGQNHHKGEAVVGGVAVVNPGPFGKSYVRFDLDVDRATKKVIAEKHEIVDVTGTVGSPAFPPPAEMIAIAESARQKVKSLAGDVLGRLGKPLQKGTFEDSPIGHFVVDTWLDQLPDVDAAICNHGAFRQPLKTGVITMGDLLSVMPFENNLFIVHITGKQLKDELAIDGPVVGGITWSYREGKDGKRTVVSVVDRKGRPLDDHKKYAVAINDFMYNGGDGFTFKEIDGAPEDTGLSWRQPVIRILRLDEAMNRRAEPESRPRARRVN